VKQRFSISIIIVLRAKSGTVKTRQVHKQAEIHKVQSRRKKHERLINNKVQPTEGHQFYPHLETPIGFASFPRMLTYRHITI